MSFSQIPYACRYADLLDPRLKQTAPTAVSQRASNTASSYGTSIASNIEAAAPATSQFTGDAHELQWKDVQTITTSGQVGRVYLIDTYAEGVHSFVIIPISPD